MLVSASLGKYNNIGIRFNNLPVTKVGIYTLTWIPITIIGWCNRHKTEWSHTIHTRAMSVEDMNKNK